MIQEWKDHYILWSRSFQTVNLKVKASYIIVLSEVFGKKANLRLPLLHIFGGCAMLGSCT